ncbi:MAG: hypothetical protein DRP84_09320 [Spirochaetes bacterium]|nr:MAG: hypothetical protein DRP84_09320 [Spirochaetota bacterium]
MLYLFKVYNRSLLQIFIYALIIFIIFLLNRWKSKSLCLPFISIAFLPKGKRFLIFYEILINIFSLSFISSALISLLFPLYNNIPFSLLLIILANVISITTLVIRGKNEIYRFYY